MPADDVATALGRTAPAVKTMRVKLRRGYSGPAITAWSHEEDRVVLDTSLSAIQMEQRLPGRSLGAIRTRRAVIGAPHSFGNRDPHAPGPRPLIARTCKDCGLLLPAEWFRLARSRHANIRRAECRKCASIASVEYEAALSDERAAGRRERAVSYRATYALKAQALTAPLAAMSGQEYTESDHAVLSDPTRTALDKALSLRRTYVAVVHMMSVNGYKSVTGIPDPALEQWLIDNPNADRIDEITASLTERELVSAGNVRPDFEWDD